jgi:hypothetical protein
MGRPGEEAATLEAIEVSFITRPTDHPSKSTNERLMLE